MAVLSLFVRFVIIVTVVMSIVDVIDFYAISKNPQRLTALFVVLMITGTVIPIAVNLDLGGRYSKLHRNFVRTG